MLARRDLGQAALLAQGLHLEERDEGANLLLDGLEADERVELGLELLEERSLLGLGAGLRLQAVELLGEPLAFGPPLSRSRSPRPRRARPASSRGLRGMGRNATPAGCAES